MLPPARAGCVKAGRFSAATVRFGLYTTEHGGRLDGFGRLLLSCYLSVIVSARVIPITNVLSAGLATKSMARAMFASTYIRQLRSGLPRCCLHGRSCRRDGAHLLDGRLANADLRCGHTATHPTRPTHPTGVSELSAMSSAAGRAPVGRSPVLSLEQVVEARALPLRSPAYPSAASCSAPSR
jgi:hypothetical protein